MDTKLMSKESLNRIVLDMTARLTAGMRKEHEGLYAKGEDWVKLFYSYFLFAQKNDLQKVSDIDGHVGCL